MLERKTSAKYKSTFALATEPQNTRYQKKQTEPPQSRHVHYYFPSSLLAITDYDIGERPVQYVNGPLRVDT
jgi:hypothetical protein